MSWKSFDKAAEDGPESLFLWAVPRIVIAVVAIAVIVVALAFASNPFRQAAVIVNKTIDADNVIANYEWFKRRYQDIQSIDQKIASASAAVDQFKSDAGDREKWKREDREEYSRLSSICLGLTQQRSDLAAEYNARSRMVNRSVFKAGDTELPESIPLK